MSENDTDSPRYGDKVRAPLVIADPGALGWDSKQGATGLMLPIVNAPGWLL